MRPVFTLLEGWHGALGLESDDHTVTFVIHPGFDDEELRAATRERSSWGSAWRRRDYDFFASDQFREILAQQKILVTWRELVREASPKYKCPSYLPGQDAGRRLSKPE